MNLRTIPPRIAFTLVELLVSMAVLIVIMVVLLSITDSTQRIWRSTSQRIDAFRSARTGFETITRFLAQATLNTYWDYNSTTAPTDYVRRSELRFISLSGTAISAPGLTGTLSTQAVFFQAPLGYVQTTAYYGMENLLNTYGYFVRYGNDSSTRPTFLSTLTPQFPLRTRFRLTEMCEPSEALTMYTMSNGNPGYNGTQWFTTPLGIASDIHVVADNVIALVFLPQLPAKADTTGTSLAPNYSYTTAPPAWPPPSPQPIAENQLPPLVQVTMVAIDETSAQRLNTISGGNPIAKLGLPNLFQTAGDLVNAGNPGYAQDLVSLSGTLQALHLSYRVFTSEVSIRGAKWSEH